MAFALVREIRIGLELVERRVTNDAARADRLIGFKRVVALSLLAEVRAAMILIVALGYRDAPLALNLANRAGRVERRPGIANQVGVESLARSHAACGLAPITEIDRDGIVRMTGRNDDRRLDPSVAHGESR